MAIYAWDSEVSTDNLINNALTAINNEEHPEAPGNPGWTVILPWAPVEQTVQNLNTSDVTESEDDKANTDSKMIRNADGSAPRICLARWVKNYWIEITPKQVITPDGIIAMFLFIVMAYPNESPNQNAPRPVVMIAGGTEAVGLEELQEDLVHSVMIGNYDRITSNHLYAVSMTEDNTFQDLARKLQEERDDFNARRATGDPSADGPCGFGKSPPMIRHSMSPMRQKIDSKNKYRRLRKFVLDVTVTN